MNNAAFLGKFLATESISTMWEIPNSSDDINVHHMIAVPLYTYFCSAIENVSDNIASDARTKMSTLLPLFNLYGLMTAYEQQVPMKTTHSNSNVGKCNQCRSENEATIRILRMRKHTF